jgi:flagella basal body P-ring formation protein FlgA
MLITIRCSARRFSELAEFSFFGMLSRCCDKRKRKPVMARGYRGFGVVAAAAVFMLMAVDSSARASEIEDPAAIRDAVEAAVRPQLATMKDARVEIEVGTIDPRLRLPPCPALDVSVPTTRTPAISVKVSCFSPQWSLYVPVRIHAWVEAVVAATNLAPNTKISARDLARGQVDAFAASGGLLTDPRQAEGKVLRGAVMMGAPVPSPLLDQPVTVHRGQRVVLTLTDRTMTIRTTAIAMEDGRIGDNIAVQNPDSRKMLHATVDQDGGVELKF